MGIEINVDEFERGIMGEIVAELNKLFRERKSDLEKRSKTIFRNGLFASKEYVSLTQGQLRGHFGLSDILVVDDIVNGIVDLVRVEFNTISYNKSSLDGGISVIFFDGDYSKIVRDSSAYYYSNQNRIDWLEWLLLEGQRIIVEDYKILFGSTKSIKEYSRSGTALMIKSSRNPGWSVPYGFAGVQSDNWITRTIEKINPQLEDMFRSILLRSPFGELVV